MKVGLIADIHGNIAALDAVLNDMPAVDAVLCAGDAVGYYPDANEACDRLRQIGARVVRGNHDAYVTGQSPVDAMKAGAYRTSWTRENLNATNLEWLAALPVEIELRLAHRLVRLRHASPWDEETYLYPDSPRLVDVVLGADEILVVGHTHHPLAQRCGAGLLINPGSVGQPRDWDPRASYAMLDLDSFTVEHRRVSYDVVGLQRRLSAMGWDGAAIEILSRRRAAEEPR